MRGFPLLLCVLCVSLALPAAADESPILGKPLPTFELSHPLQGDAWQHGDLKGNVVVLDLFQVG